MSNAAERYIRCPHCRYPNLAGTGVCTQCDTDLEEEISDDFSRAASETWYEVRRLAICAGVGVLAGGLIALIAVAATRGLWLHQIADTVLPSYQGGRGTRMGWAVVAAVPIFWAFVAPRMMKSVLGGRIEVFEEEEIRVGTWASGVLTVILVAIALAVSDARALFQNTAEPWRELERFAPFLFWLALPWICQAAAVVASVATHRWLDARGE